MAATQVIAVNVYEIDGLPVTPYTETFPPSLTGKYTGSDSRLYAVIKPYDLRTYAVVETASTLKTLWNS